MGKLTDASFRDPSQNSNRRIGGRVRCDTLSSSLGEVLDLSSTGMKVRLGRKVQAAEGGIVDVQLIFNEESATLHGKVIWIRPPMGKDREAGVQFVNLGSEQKRTLTAIALMARDKLSIGRLAS